VQIVKHNNKAFTLVEMLVAITILTIGMLAALEGLVLYMQQNLNSLSRDESVRIAEQKMNELRNLSYTSITSGSSTIKRKIKRFEKNFTVAWTVTNLSSNSVSIEVTVKWTILNKEWSHAVRSIVSRG